MEKRLETVKSEIVNQMNQFIADAAKRPTKAAHQRMRKATLNLAKLGKEFRQLSLEEDKK